MEKLVFESLDELFEAKKIAEEKKRRKPKPTNIKATHAKIEKEKAKKVQQDKKDSIKEKIAALETQKKEARKPGPMKQTKAQKDAKIAEIQKKIDTWNKKLKELK